MLDQLLVSLKKARIIIHSSPEETIDCTFNPSEYSIHNGTNYHEHRGLGNSNNNLQFANRDSTVLHLNLFFDSTADGDASRPITDKTRKLAKAMRAEKSHHEPPMVTFDWGNLQFSGYIVSMEESYTMFSNDGMPIRARIHLTIKEEEDPDLNRRVEPFESPDRTKVKTIIDGMSLWQIAYEEYGDSDLWRVIARENDILNPLDIYPGQLIRIPALKGE